MEKLTEKEIELIQNEILLDLDDDYQADAGTKALMRLFSVYCSNTDILERIESLATLWRQQADSYKDQPEADDLAPMGVIAAATVYACAKEVQNILAGKEPEPHD